MATIKAQTLKGFRDFMPEEARKRQYVISRLRSVFESYGFEPLETPALEYEEVLLGKYGSEGDKLMYRFEDNGKRRVALRYDQTVPLARYIGQNYQTITFPFKRYQIQPVWRAENTQKGRYREFLQCDVDTVGTSSESADAEIIALVSDCYKALGFKNVKIKVNDKSFLYERFRAIGVAENKLPEVALQVDKLGRLAPLEVGRSIYSSTASIAPATTLSGTIGSIEEYRSPSDVKKKTMQDWIQDTNKGAVSINQVQDLLQEKEDLVVNYFKTYNPDNTPSFVKDLKAILKDLGFSGENIIYDETVARGLDYYTGLIFEVEVEEYKGGSIGGGGRYDNLIGMFTGKQIPAVGFAFGFDRIIEAMDQLKLFPAEISKATAKVLVTSLPEYEKNALELATKLRKEQINAELYLEPAKLEKQLKYADKKCIPYIAIIGSNEAKTNKIALKNLKTQQQQTLTIDSLVKLLKAKE